MPTKMLFENPNREEELARYLPKLLAQAILLKLQTRQEQPKLRGAVGQA